MTDIFSTDSTIGNGKPNQFFNADAVAKYMASIYIPEKKNGVNVTTNNKEDDSDETPAATKLRSVSDGVAEIRNDNKRASALLSDVEIAIKLLCSSIISPNDMGDTGFSYIYKECGESTEVMNRIVDVVREYIEDNYDLSANLEHVIRELIAVSGAYTRIVVPETSIDKFINGRVNDKDAALEEFKQDFSDFSIFKPKQLGFVVGGESTDDLSLESLLSNSGATQSYVPMILDDGIEALDNPSVLRLPMLRDKLLKTQIHNSIRLNTSIEGVNERRQNRKAKKIKEKEEKKAKEDVGDDGVKTYNLSTVTRNFDTKETDEIETTDATEALTRPLFMSVPTESIIPVHRPNEPSKHIGYYLVLDKNYSPLAIPFDGDLCGRLQKAKVTYVQQKAQMSESMAKAYGEIFGNEEDKDQSRTLPEILTAYRIKIENNMIEGIKNGVYGEHGTISLPEEIAELMLIRKLAETETKVLFLPAELVSYMALDYRPNGTGKTRLENARFLHAMRALMLISNTNAAVKNSIRAKDLKLIIDKDDPTPQKTAKLMLAEYFKREGADMPYGSFDPYDLQKYVNYNSINVTYEGNTRLPQTNIEIAERQGNVTKPDSEYEQKLKEDSIMSLGLPVMAVDDTIQADYATTIASSNLMVAKQVRNDQIIVCKEHTNLVRMIIYSSGELRTLIKQELQEQKLKFTDEIADEDIDQHLIELADYISVKLPEPNTTKLEAQSKLLTTFVSLVDTSLDAVFNRDALGSNLGELGDGIEPAKNAIRGLIIRNFMKKQNILPELDIITDITDGGSTLFKQHKEYADSLLFTVKELALELAKASREYDRDSQKVIDKENEKYNTDDTTTTDDTSGTSDTGTDDTATDDSTAADDTAVTGTDTATADDTTTDDTGTGTGDDTAGTDDSGSDLDLGDFKI